MKRRTAWILVAGVAAVALGAAAVGALALLLRGPPRRRAGLRRQELPGRCDLEGETPRAALGGLRVASSSGVRRRCAPWSRASIARPADPKVTAVVVGSSFLSDAGWGKVQELRDAIAALPQVRQAGLRAPRVLREQGVLPGHRLHEDLRAADGDPRRVGALGRGDVLPQDPRQARRRGAVRGRREVQERPQHRSPRAPSPSRTASRWRRCVDSLFEQYVDGHREGARQDRGGGARASIDRGPYDGAGGARGPGSSTSCCTRTRSDKRLKGADAPDARPLRPRPRAASASTAGPRSPSSTPSATSCRARARAAPFGGRFAGSDTVAGALREAREDDDIKAIVLRVDSPGGFGPGGRRDPARGAARAEGQARRRLDGRPARPPAATTSRSAATRIVAEPGTITGSIGVFSGKFSLRGPLRQDRRHARRS